MAWCLKSWNSNSFKHENFAQRKNPRSKSRSISSSPRRSTGNLQLIDRGSKRLGVLFQKFENYCNPRRNITFERHKFFTCIQEPTESIDQYVTELRTKASTCEFGELCKSYIRDRIVCGISCNTLREKLLQETDLSHY